MTPLVQLEDLTLAFAGVRALDGVSLSVDAGALFAVIGPNGAGKTSLFNCISGVYRPSAGRVVLGGRDLSPLPPHRIAALGVSRMFQNPALFPAMTVLRQPAGRAPPPVPGRLLAEGLSGFSHPATMTVGAMFILSAALHHTGAVDFIGKKLVSAGKRNFWLALVTLMLISGAFSAFINDTAVVAIFLPVALSLAVSPGWLTPLLTHGLSVALELLSNNVVEPWLYGRSTGVSPIALIVAAVWWTWLWGPVGLVLAPPMTVCLVVMGRHIPRLSFLGVLLSDEEALTPAEDCYYRLITIGEQDELELVESYLKSNSLTALYDCVLIAPVSPPRFRG